MEIYFFYFLFFMFMTRIIKEEGCLLFVSFFLVIQNSVSNQMQENVQEFTFQDLDNIGVGIFLLLVIRIQIQELVLIGYGKRRLLIFFVLCQVRYTKKKTYLTMLRMFTVYNETYQRFSFFKPWFVPRSFYIHVTYYQIRFLLDLIWVGVFYF